MVGDYAVAVDDQLVFGPVDLALDKGAAGGLQGQRLFDVALTWGGLGGEPGGADEDQRDE